MDRSITPDPAQDAKELQAQVAGLMQDSRGLAGGRPRLDLLRATNPAESVFLIEGNRPFRVKRRTSRPDIHEGVRLRRSAKHEPGKVIRKSL
jgi:hypothetical protein